MSLLNNKTTGTTNSGSLNTNINLDGDKFRLYLNNKGTNKNFYSGSLYLGDGEDRVSNRLTWNMDKYDAPALKVNLAGTSEEDYKTFVEVTYPKYVAALKTRILNVAERKGHGIYDAYIARWGTESEVAMDSSEPEVKEEEKIVAPEPTIDTNMSAAKAYCKSLGTTSSLAALTHLLANPIVKTVEVVKEFTDEELEEIIYDRMPAEIMAKVDGYDALVIENEKLMSQIAELKNIQPEVIIKTPVVENNIDIVKLKTEIKSELKAELLAELKVSTKAPSQPAPIVKEEKKTDDKVDTKLVIPGKATKKEETKVSAPAPAPEAPKKKSIKDLTIEDLTNMDYTKLQALGSKLSLGAKNVAKKEELINLIAVKLKLKTATKIENNKESDKDTNLVLTKTSNSSLADKRKNSTWSDEEDAMLDEIIDEEDFSSKSTVSSKIELTAKQQALAAFLKNGGK